MWVAWGAIIVFAAVVTTGCVYAQAMPGEDEKKSKPVREQRPATKSSSGSLEALKETKGSKAPGKVKSKEGTKSVPPTAPPIRTVPPTELKKKAPPLSGTFIAFLRAFGLGGAYQQAVQGESPERDVDSVSRFLRRLSPAARAEVHRLTLRGDGPALQCMIVMLLQSEGDTSPEVKEAAARCLHQFVHPGDGPRYPSAVVEYRQSDPGQAEANLDGCHGGEDRPANRSGNSGFFNRIFRNR